MVLAPRTIFTPDAPFVSDTVSSCGVTQEAGKVTFETGKSYEETNSSGTVCLVLRWSAHDAQLGKGSKAIWQLQEAPGETLDDVDAAAFKTVAWTHEPFFLAPVLGGYDA